MATRNNTWSGFKNYTPTKSKNKQPEYELQVAVCNFLAFKYPNIFFNGSAGGMRTYLSVAKRMKATGYKAGFPDLFIYEARNGYHGLAIELKVKGLNAIYILFLRARYLKFKGSLNYFRISQINLI